MCEILSSLALGEGAEEKDHARNTEEGSFGLFGVFIERVSHQVKV
jgi:hypothetical protein